MKLLKTEDKEFGLGVTGHSVLVGAGILILVVALLGWCVWCATRPTVGVVDFNIVQKNAKVYQYVQTEQNKYAEQIRIRIMADSKDIETDAQKLEKQKDKLSADEYQRKLRDLQRRATKVQEKYRPAMERIMLASQVALNGAAKEISLAVEKTAQEKGVKILLSMNNVLYASNKVDMTDAFVKNLDQQIQTVVYPDPANLGR